MSDNVDSRRGSTDVSVHAPDTVKGLYTCCKSIDPRHVGCKANTEHSTGQMQCTQCGVWVHRDDQSRFGACQYHPGAVKTTKWGAVQWDCCGSAGYEGTIYDYVRAIHTAPHRPRPLLRCARERARAELCRLRA